MDPEKIMDGLSDELNATLKAMAKAKTVEEKVEYSKAVKNLTESLGIFLNLATNVMPFDLEE